MDIEKKGNEIIVKHTLKRGETYKFINNKKFKTLSFFKKPKTIKGFASSCSDGKHILFIDYDNTPKWLVEQDYRRLQEEDNIPEGYLFTTHEEKDSEGFMSGNYHVISLSKHNPGHIRNMIMKTHADVNFMSMPLRNKYKNWVLRIGPKGGREKPKYLGKIGEGKNNNYQISTAHFDILKKLYNISDNWENQDKLNKVFLQEYETMNY